MQWAEGGGLRFGGGLTGHADGQPREKDSITAGNSQPHKQQVGRCYSSNCPATRVLEHYACSLATRLLALVALPRCPAPPTP